MKHYSAMFFKWQVFFWCSFGWFLVQNVNAVEISSPSLEDIIASIHIEEKPEQNQNTRSTPKEQPSSTPYIMDDKLEIICTKTNHSNLRKAPGTKFPIEYKVLVSGYPFKVVKTVSGWYGVEDFEGEVSWISEINIKKKCGAIVQNPALTFVYLHPSLESKVMLSLERGFIVHNIECFGEWCEVKIQNKTGWMEKKDLWGNLK